VAHELVTQVAELFAGLLRIAVAAVRQQCEDALFAFERVRVRVFARVVLVARRVLYVGRTLDIAVVRFRDAARLCVFGPLERIVALPALAARVFRRSAKTIGGGIVHLTRDLRILAEVHLANLVTGRTAERLIEPQESASGTLRAHHRFIPLADRVECAPREIRREILRQPEGDRPNRTLRERQRAALGGKVALRAFAAVALLGIVLVADLTVAAVALPVFLATLIRQRIGVDVQARHEEVFEVGLALVLGQAADADVLLDAAGAGLALSLAVRRPALRGVASAACTAVRVARAVPLLDRGAGPAARVARLVRAEQAEAIELVVRLGQRRVLVVRRHAQKRIAHRRSGIGADAADRQTRTLRRPRLLRHERHVVDGVFVLREIPLVAPRVVLVIADADELRLVRLREVRAGARLNEERQRVAPERREQLVRLNVVRRKVFEQVARPIDTHELAFVPLAIGRVLDRDVVGLTGEVVVLLAHVDVIVDREHRERLAEEVGVVRVAIAARDQLVRSIGKQELLVDHESHARDRERISGRTEHVGAAAVVVERVVGRHRAAERRERTRRVEHERFVVTDVDRRARVPPLAVEDRLLDQVGLHATDRRLLFRARRRQRNQTEERHVHDFSDALHDAPQFANTAKSRMPELRWISISSFRNDSRLTMRSWIRSSSS
jgi:hypothetical protein